jgi:hypothetical protein
MQDIKKEVIDLLVPIFGEGVKEQLIKNYDSDKPQDIIELTHRMLTSYMGEKNADLIIEKVLKKFPELKIQIH